MVSEQGITIHDQFLYTHLSDLTKVSRLNLVHSLYWTPLFEWCVVRCDSNTDTNV